MPGPETTARLLDLIRDGDEEARERLVRRLLPALQRWARGRLPVSARDLAETDDVVQVSLMRALKKVKGFESQGKGSFLAYVRQIILNEIRDQWRRSRRRPGLESLDDQHAAAALSPLEEAIGSETLAAFETALATLPTTHQEAVICRVELGFTHAQVAEALGFASSNAARMCVSRALARIAEVMDEQAQGSPGADSRKRR